MRIRCLTPSRPIIWIAAFAGVASSLVYDARPAALSAQAIVEQSTVFVGEPFLFQIDVSAQEQPAQPDVSALVDFTVEPLGATVPVANPSPL